MSIDNAELNQLPASPDLLSGLSAAARARKDIEQLEATLVGQAREQGLSWAQIAEAVGVTKQAIHQRYGGGGSSCRAKS